MRVLLRLLVVLIVLAGLAGGALFWEETNFDGPGPVFPDEPAQVVVLIKPGIGLRGIADALKADGVIDNPDLFLWGVRLRRTTAALKAGEYAIPSRASMRDIMDILIAGKSIEHKITAAEGLTSDMIAKLINADAELTGDPVAVPAEGTLLPETYLFLRGATRQDILDRMTAAQKKLIARLWPRRDANLPYKTVREAIILASIVEKETSLAEERRHIAAIFVNRLRIGMKLQSDPTIIYSLTGGYPLGRGIRMSELNRVTPYNTYAVAGLTPTPICNPGKDAIAAVLNPGTTNDLYFVASGTGGHLFSATIADQNRNVAALRSRERIRKLKPPMPEPTVPHL
ncbi:MAG: endolytic transglycosylase MltG [Rhizomicrobium sp.]